MTAIVIACLLGDVLAALTVAYNLLVGGLLVPILGGLVWKRGNLPGALAAMIAGGITVITLMVVGGCSPTSRSTSACSPPSSPTWPSASPPSRPRRPRSTPGAAAWRANRLTAPEPAPVTV